VELLVSMSSTSSSGWLSFSTKMPTGASALTMDQRESDKNCTCFTCCPHDPQVSGRRCHRRSCLGADSDREEPCQTTHCLPLRLPPASCQP
jgi:hypothetical protein